MSDKNKIELISTLTQIQLVLLARISNLSEVNNLITTIKDEVEGKTDDEFLKAVIGTELLYRRERSNIDKQLEELEMELWNKLTDKNN